MNAVEAVVRIGIGPISTGPVTAESGERCGRLCMYRMIECGTVGTPANTEISRFTINLANHQINHTKNLI
jgi:hypothetical protein